MNIGENKLLTKKHILICFNNNSNNKKIEFIIKHFCGIVITELNQLEIVYEHCNNYNNSDNSNNYNKCDIYICGDVSATYELIKTCDINNIFVIKEFSSNWSSDNNMYKLIDDGKVPINVHNVGVLIRNALDDKTDYFKEITDDHKNIQKLSESDKKTFAFRQGYYGCNVTESNKRYSYNLLRCSTNFNGPTHNFKQSDNKIIDTINDVAKSHFDSEVKFNHVLAQIYINTKTNIFLLFLMKIVNYLWNFIFGKQYFNLKISKTEKKAKIKAHSDKTKDMPSNGLLAFCSLYKNYSNRTFNDFVGRLYISNDDPYDYCYKGQKQGKAVNQYNGQQSVLTKLYFKLKDDVNNNNLVKDFYVTLYPNSVFIISKEMNRLYTHEIRPSGLPIDNIPVRMGYVARCSNTKAVYHNGNTYIYDDFNGVYQKLEKGSVEDFDRLRELYLKENLTSNVIEYGFTNFSMNSGDYKQPLL